MRGLLSLLKKDLSFLLKKDLGLMITPIIVILMMTSLEGLDTSGDIKIALYTPDNSDLGAKIMGTLDTERVPSIEAGRGMVNRGEVAVFVILPENIDALAAKEMGEKIQVVYDGRQINSYQVGPVIEGLIRGDREIKVEYGGKRSPDPSLLLFALVFAGITVPPYIFSHDKDSLNALLLAPVPSDSIFLSKSIISVLISIGVLFILLLLINGLDQISAVAPLCLCLTTIGIAIGIIGEGKSSTTTGIVPYVVLFGAFIFREPFSMDFVETEPARSLLLFVLFFLLLGVDGLLFKTKLKRRRIG